MEESMKQKLITIGEKLIKWVITTVIAYVYILVMLMIISLVLLNIWNVTFIQIQHITFILTLITSVVYFIKTFLWR